MPILRLDRNRSIFPTATMPVNETGNLPIDHLLVALPEMPDPDCSTAHFPARCMILA